MNKVATVANYYLSLRYLSFFNNTKIEVVQCCTAPGKTLQELNHDSNQVVQGVYPKPEELKKWPNKQVGQQMWSIPTPRCDLNPEAIQILAKHRTWWSSLVNETKKCKPLLSNNKIFSACYTVTLNVSCKNSCSNVVNSTHYLLLTFVPQGDH